jgi:Asp-tRNA(Asn)/Glu-tRNA(Gln) amidotransferase C subunit
MGERAVIEKGMETLAEIGTSESTTFVLPQELTSLVGRYGKHLTGSDAKTNGHELDSLAFDEETRKMLGLDDIEEILGQIDQAAEMDVEQMEQEAQAIKEGADTADIKDPDEVIQEMDAEMDIDADVPGGDGGSGGSSDEGSSTTDEDREPEPESGSG